MSVLLDVAVLVLLVVAMQFQDTSYTVQEGEDAAVYITLEASKAHDFGFEVNVRCVDGTAKRMLIP